MERSADQSVKSQRAHAQGARFDKPSVKRRMSGRPTCDGTAYILPSLSACPSSCKPLLDSRPSPQTQKITVSLSPLPLATLHPPLAPYPSPSRAWNGPGLGSLGRKKKSWKPARAQGHLIKNSTIFVFFRDAHGSPGLTSELKYRQSCCTYSDKGRGFRHSQHQP